MAMTCHLVENQQWNVKHAHGSIHNKHTHECATHTHLTTHRSEVVPDIAKTLTAWVVPAVRDRQSLMTHGKDCRCEAVHDTKAGSPPGSEKRLYAGTEGKVPREGSCGYCGWPAG